MEKVPLCPLRKSNRETGNPSTAKMDMFLACLQGNCSWYNEKEKKCAVSILADSIHSIELHGILAATTHV